MTESCKATAVAVVAALILKLWPAYSIVGRLAEVNAFLISSTNLYLEKGVLSCRWKRAPGRLPCLAKYPNKAVTGQRSSLVLPRTTWQPTLS